ncbi:MAG TPA: ATP-binding protein [Ignavibacteriaceae bacterium]|nr:ATP-binding protein [Ignavibacteriaceae bacterium]
MSQNKDSILITGNKLFTGISEAELKVNFSSKNLTAIKEGEVIFQNGGSSEEIYLLVDGEVKIKFPNPAGAPIIGTKTKNDFFGEKEFIEKTPRKSSAVAETNCLIFVINRSEYLEIIALNPVVKNNLPLENSSESFQKNISDNLSRNNSRRQWIIEPEVNVMEHKDDEALKNKEEKVIEPETPSTATPDEKKDDEVLIAGKNIDDLPIEDLIETKEEKDEINLEWDFSNLPLQEDNSLQANDYFQEPNETPVNWNFSEDNSFRKDEAPEKFEEIPKISELQFYEILDAIKRINTNLQIGNVSEQTIKETIYLTGAESGRIYFKDKNDNEFYGLVPGTNEKNEIRIKINEGITGISAAENKIININNPTEDIRYYGPFDNPGDDNLENLLSFPISNEQGEVIAILELFNSPKEIFSEEEINLLSRLSPIISQAIENASTRTVSTQENQLPTVNKIANFLIGDLDPSIMLIKYYSDIIRKKNISSEINPVLAMIYNQAELINNSLISMMNFISDKNTLTMRKENINDIMNDIVSMLAEYVELRKVKLYKKFSGSANVMIDRKEFYQACYQITKNACDAMPDGGEIFIITKTTGDFASIEFRDTGSGIPEELQSKIFEPFFSFGKSNKTGLGLAIAEKIIRNHGGNISVSKSEGSGSIFSISLPVIN